MRYRWVLFDADGTLFDFAKTEARALERTFEESGHGFQPVYAETFERINSQMWLAFEEGRVSQDELKVTRFQRLLAEVNVETDPEVFGTQYLMNLAEGIDLIEGAEDVLRSLHGKVGLMMITNGLADVQRRRFARSTISDYFEDFVISEEVGSAKPDCRIFEIAFERMGSPHKAEVLLVGDSLSSDIKGGNMYGVDVCWFNPGRKPRAPELEIQYEIRDLGELVGILSSEG